MAKRPAPTPEPGNDRAETLPAMEAAQSAAGTAAPAEAAQAPSDLNTEAPQDSPEGGAPAGAEGAIMAGGTDSAPADAEAGRDPASATAPEIEEDRAALMRAVASIGTEPAVIMPTMGRVEVFEVRRVATVASTIEHHGWRFAPGAPIPLTEAEFTGLKGSGALVETDWDALPEI